MSAPPPTVLVLFDIDGTLVAPGGAGRAALLEAGKQLFGGAFDLDGFDPSGKLDPAIFDELARRHPQLAMHSRAGTFQARYLRALRRRAHAIRALPGARDALRRLAREPDVALGILTGNVPAVASLKLEASGLTPRGAPDPFAVRVHGDEALHRADLVALALERFRADRRPTPTVHPVVVGDTPRDVEAAHAHGAPVLAVATGRWDADALRAAGADRVVEDLLDLRALLDLIAATLASNPRPYPTPE